MTQDGFAAAGPEPCVQVAVKWEGPRWIRVILEEHRFCLGFGPCASFILVEPGSASLFQVSQTSNKLLHGSDTADPETTPEGKETP